MHPFIMNVYAWMRVVHLSSATMMSVVSGFVVEVTSVNDSVCFSTCIHVVYTQMNRRRSMKEEKGEMSVND